MLDAAISTAESTRCLNCASVLHGPFCSQCGQEHSAGPVSLREYVRDVLDDLGEFDSKLFRSLWPLVAKPGFLTLEFLAGKRVSYLLPSRFYILVSIVFFFLVNHFDPVTVEAMGAGSLGMEPGMVAGINEAVADLLPPFMLAVIPAFAGGLWLMYVRRGFYFTHHLTFAFHFFAFVFAAFALPVLTGSDALWNLAFPGVFAYLFLALRRVYAQSIAKTLLKTGLLYVHFWVLLLFYFGFVFLVARVQTGG